jgi:hypothetical protein
MRYVTAKLGTMRKPQEFSVRPMSDGRVIVTSDKSTGTFDPLTGQGVLNQKGAYFVHLSAALGAKPYTYPAEFIAECRAVVTGQVPETVLAGGAVRLTNMVTVVGEDPIPHPWAS